MSTTDFSFQLTIVDPVTSVLSQTKAAMVAAGTRWAQWTTAPANQAVLNTGSTNSGNHYPFANEASWSQPYRRIEFVGQDHYAGGTRHLQYNETTNAWALVSTFSENPSHGYDHNAVDPATGDVYYRGYTSWTIRRFAGATWDAAYTTAPPGVSGYAQSATGAGWWSGALTGVGARGCFLLFDNTSITGPRIYGYDPLSASWPINISCGSGWTDTYHSLLSYSSVKNVAVFGGGNSNPRRLFRLNANATITELGSAPVDIGINSSRLTCDPVSGNFIVFNATQVWELDPTGSGTWTLQTGNRALPFTPKIPDGCICVSLPLHGAIGVINFSGGANQFWMYRHA